MTRERRKFARISLDVAANLFLYQVDMRHAGAIIDLSLGGCFFPVKSEIPLGEKCQIQLAVGEGLETSTIDLAGIIVRKDARGVGIQFTNMTPEGLASLKQLIALEHGAC